MKMNTMKNTLSLSARLLLVSSTVCMTQFSATSASAQNCALDAGGVLEEDCDHTNATTAVSMPAPENLEFEVLPNLNSDGFELSVDGNGVTDDGQIVPSRRVPSADQRLQDLALDAENIAVQFDGANVDRRLDVRVLGNTDGQTVTFINEMNYPAFARSGEIRIIEKTSAFGSRTIQTVDMDPNSKTVVSLPETDGQLYFVYRVYNNRGRFDETAVASLDELTRRTGNDTEIELGTDTLAIKRIPINGGAVTVSGYGLAPNTTVSALGTKTTASPEGKFVIQRIIPEGKHAIDVDVAGKPFLTRDLEVKSHELFFVGIADVTIGTSLENELLDATGEDYDEVYTKGRVAFYLKGKVKGEYLITASLDTGEEDLDEIFDNFDDKTAQGLLERIDPDDYYPVYGDDSTYVEDAPTSGKLYVKVERGNSYALWGDYQSNIEETEYMRNQRALYGAQLQHETQQVTSRGEARGVVQLYAASPDTLPAKDRFVGTGGSTYFLKNNDITPGSETLEVEVINPVTGQVITRETLVFGVDYDINYLQGLIILRRPLSGSAQTDELINESVAGDNETQLVASYEYTPGATSVDGYSYGGRAQAWITDNIRVGVTSHYEEKGTSDLDVSGVDLRLQLAENSYFDVEYAESSGDGFIESISGDGGLTFSTSAASTGSGEAIRVYGMADLQEVGVGTEGQLEFYYEDQTAGFASLTTQTDVDLTRWGVSGSIEATDGLTFGFDYDDYEDSTGKTVTEGSVEVAFDINERTQIEVGVEQYDIVSPGDPANTGDRTDVAARLTFSPNEDDSYYVFGQFTTDVTGGLEENDRYGVGADLKLNENWSVSGEVSDGTDGFGALFLATYDKDENSSYYFGYKLDPARTMGSTAGNDRGQYVAGARTRITDDLAIFAENTYDLFGQHRSLTSAYGATYDFSEYLTFTGGIELGTVSDPTDNTDLERKALSLGAAYRSEDMAWSGRLEYRVDDGESAGEANDGETFAFTGTLRYDLDEEQRLLVSAEYVDSNNDAGTIPDAEYGEFLLGYAYRPIDNDRLNVLAKYRYVYDVTSRTTTAVGTDANFEETPRQKSHILSVDASYDLNNHWTLGGKFGGRWTEQDDGAGFVSNDAWLGVANLRYHVVHNWDALLEVRHLEAEQTGSESGVVAAAYRHFGNNLKVGVGYNFGRFSDDLADLTYDDQGLFLNFIAKY